MLVEANDFYTHVNANVIVDTPHDMRFEVAMKVKPGPVMGGIMFSPPSLLDLYQLSELVVIAHIGRSTVVESDGRVKLIKSTLRISEQFKGENSQQVIPLYYRVDDFDPTTFNPGDRLLVLLRRRETEDGKRLDGYEMTFSRDSIKKLDEGALGVYRQRIEELSAIFRRGATDPPELVEWLVRCVEELATRGDGVRELAESLYRLASQRDQENRDKSRAGRVEESDDQTEEDKKDSNEQPDDDEAIMVIDGVKLASALTQDHKNRLTSALFNIAELNDADMEFVGMTVELGDERLAPYLVSQLRRVSGDAPRFAESLVWMIAQVFRDEDLKLLAGDYDNAATYDENEYDEADRLNSTLKRRSGDVTVAAVKRSAMLKDFLKLVEYKSKR